MSKEEMIKQIEEEYCHNWEPAPQIDKVKKDVGELYDMEKNLIGYFKLKSEVIRYLSMNCVEEFERGKIGQGILTKKILENLLFDLSEAEFGVKIK